MTVGVTRVLWAGVRSNRARGEGASLTPEAIAVVMASRMNPSLVFRRTLANRILALIAVTLPTAPGCESTRSGGCEPDPIESEVCIAPADAGAADGGTSQISCPSRDDARPALEAAANSAVDEVKSDATVKDGECCYVAVMPRVCMGRPYLVNETTRTAEPIRGGAARANAPSVGTLDPTTRKVL
ncbi:MAG: Plectin 1, partial [Labilithrix sp.]|nr:Plectin 1 [Labilithrix sp.]